MQPAQRRVAETGRSMTDAQLVQARALAYQDRKSLRADFGIERAAIAGLYPIEGWRVIGDQPREDIDAPRRAFGIGACEQIGSEIE